MLCFWGPRPYIYIYLFIYVFIYMYTLLPTTGEHARVLEDLRDQALTSGAVDYVMGMPL